MQLSPGQAHDLEGADLLLEALLDQIKALLTDIAYAVKARILDRLEQHQVEAVIPPMSNRKQPWEFDQDKYRWRHLIENFFAELNQYRGIATRYDKRAWAFLGAIHWVAAVAKLMTGPRHLSYKLSYLTKSSELLSWALRHQGITFLL